MYSNEATFRADYDDLKRRVDGNTGADAIAASAILRRLLMDGSPLVHLANKSFRLKIQFDVCAPPDDDGMLEADFDAVVDGIDPEIYPNDPRQSLSLEQFLAYRMGSMEGVQYTVHDVIDYLANSAGGVHKNVPMKNPRMSIEKASKTYAVMNLPSSLPQIFAISRVVLDSLRPLYGAILAA